jgi:hypothetical protein
MHPALAMTIVLALPALSTAIPPRDDPVPGVVSAPVDHATIRRPGELVGFADTTGSDARRVWANTVSGTVRDFAPTGEAIMKKRQDTTAAAAGSRAVRHGERAGGTWLCYNVSWLFPAGMAGRRIT